MAQKTKTYILGKFQAGDRPTDQNFKDLFDSVLFLDNKTVGGPNGVNTDETTLAGDLEIGGTLNLTGIFTLGSQISVGNTSETIGSRAISAYNNTTNTVILASGSLSDTLFEGISGNSTSSIKLQDDTSDVRFGTHTNKGFLEIHGEEIITYSTGSSAGDNIVYMSGSLGIGTAAPAHPLVIYGAQDMSAQIQTTKTNGLANIRFINDARHWRLGVDAGDAFTLYDNTDTFTPFRVEAGAGTNTLVIDSNSRVGIGTNAPGHKLSVVGNLAIRDAANNLNVMLFSNTDSVATTPDIQFSGAAQLSAQADFNINIDSDSNSIAAKFSIKKDTDDTGGTEIFKVTEAGEVSGSSFVGNGSQLTGITGAQIVGFVTSPGDNQLVTSNATGDSITGEDNLTFDGSTLTHILNTGDTSSNGILLDGQNGGFLKMMNGTSASNEFLAILRGKSTTTTSGVSGLYLIGQPPTDNTNNPCIILRGSDNSYSGVSTASDILKIQNYQTDLITVNKDGKMGIGTTNPTSLLHISKTGDTLGEVDFIHLSQNSTTTEGSVAIKFSDGGDVTNQHFKMLFEEGSNDLMFKSDTVNDILRLDPTGNVGIGLSNPIHRLHVKSAGSNSDILVLEAASGNDLFHFSELSSNYPLMDMWADLGGTGNPLIRLRTDGNSWFNGGNIGIGTVSPTKKLHISDTASQIALFYSTDPTSHIRVERSSHTTIDLMAGATSYGGGLVGSHGLSFMVGGASISAPTINIDTSGNLHMTAGGYIVFPNVNWNSSVSNNGLIETHISRVAMSLPTTGDGITLDYGAASSATDASFVQFRLRDNLNLDRFRIYVDDYNGNDTIPLDVRGDKVLLAADGYANVGIGTDSPDSSLHIKKSGDTLGEVDLLHLSIDSSTTEGSAAIKFSDGTNAGTITDQHFKLSFGEGSNDMKFKSDSTDNILYMEHDGNVGIGTNDPAQKLQVNGPIRINEAAGTQGLQFNDVSRYWLSVGGSYNYGLYWDTSGTVNQLQFRGAGAIKAYVDLDNGNLGIDGSLDFSDSYDGVLIHNDTNTRDKIRVWNGSPYTIGMKNPMTFGGLGAYAMTFQMSNNNDRGFWWGDTSHTDAQGAMSLTTNGKLSVAYGIKVGGGESDTSTPSSGLSIANAPGAASPTEVRLGNSTGQTLKIQTTSGYLQAGPQNTNHCHFYTDRSNFYFNKELRVSGGDFCAYDGDVHIRYRTGGNDYLHINDTYSRFVVGGAEQFKVQANQINLAGHRAFNTSDSWLRINETSAFTSGIYTGTSNLTTGNALHVGVGGTAFIASTSAIQLKKTTTLTTTGYANSGWRFGNTSDYRSISFSGARLYFQRKGASGAPYIENGDNEGQISTFTGQHRNKPSQDIASYTNKKGYIVVSSGVYSNIPENRTKAEIDANNTIVLNNPQISEALPIVSLSTTSNDKKVWGVIDSWDDPSTTVRDVQVQGGFNHNFDNREDDRLIINSIGEGAIMVSNINGNLENGDYVTTSAIEGLGMKQDDDLLHNYTVAKITQDEDFATLTTDIIHEGTTYKMKLVGCTYHCG